MTKNPSTLSAIALAVGVGSVVPAMAQEAVTLWKSSDCGCCEDYAAYLGQNGFAVEVQNTDDVISMSRAAGIPDEVQGCHLAFIEDYVVSGHVPVETIRRLLTERPAIAGITLPGMPMGAPGMTGKKSEPLTIYAIGDGPPRVYAVE
jgi:hypothetical protein